MIFSKNKYFSNLVGGIIYMTGDSIASLLVNEFSYFRAVSIFVIGAVLYAFEIQLYFQWIEDHIIRFQGLKKDILKTFMALIYFNPLWIARHLCFIYFITGKTNQISFHLLRIALISFLINIPISIIANYIIQNKISFKYHFWGSAVFSGLMAIYYSMSIQWF
jgi:hypothetical protein